MTAPDSAGTPGSSGTTETAGQAAYEAWAAVLATNGVECEPFEALGNVEQMAWREVEAIAAAAPAPAGEGGDVTERIAAWLYEEFGGYDDWHRAPQRKREYYLERARELGSVLADGGQPQAAPDLTARLAAVTALLDLNHQLAWDSGLPGERKRVAEERAGLGMGALG